MKQKLKMIWRILHDRQVVVITEDHGRMYYNWDTRSLEDAGLGCAIWGLILIFSIIGSSILTYIINN